MGGLETKIHTIKPTTKAELETIINETIEKEG